MRNTTKQVTENQVLGLANAALLDLFEPHEFTTDATVGEDTIRITVRTRPATIPDLNRAAEEVRDEVFIALRKEPIVTVEPSLKRRRTA